MPKRTRISEARRRLFELVDWVLEHPDDAVYIEHRDRSEGVALIREDRLAYLEKRDREAGPPASMVGSVELVAEGSVEEIVAEVRASARADQERRMEGFSPEASAGDA